MGNISERMAWPYLLTKINVKQFETFLHCQLFSVGKC